MIDLQRGAVVLGPKGLYVVLKQKRSRVCVLQALEGQGNAELRASDLRFIARPLRKHAEAAKNITGEAIYAADAIIDGNF